MELHELAARANSFFVKKKRDSGEEFWSMKKRYPVWVMEMVHAAHGDMMPDNHKYEFVVDTLDSLEEENDPDEPELEADVYYSDLNRWFASHVERAGYVDEAVENFGHSDQGVHGDIGSGQIFEKQEVWHTVVQHLRDRLEAIELEEPEVFEGPPKSPKDWSPKERE